MGGPKIEEVDEYIYRVELRYGIMALIHMSKTAMRRLTDISTRHQSHILFGCTSGGCAGFEYTWDLLSTLPDPDPLVPEIPLGNGFDVVVCRDSLLYILGVHIDWVTTPFGEQFEYSNPNASSSCGCNVSFAPKSTIV